MSPQRNHISIAPMMDWTDRHCRFFHRLLAPHAVLYTEMVTAPAILHGDRQRLLGFDSSQHPVVLQLGGSEPDDLAQVAAIGADFGYDAINLNCGCPSERVQKGAFGACLMAEPDLVARCVEAMRKRVNIPVTVKCRIGIDAHDARTMLFKFIEAVASGGCETFIVHARKAWLKGLSPKENREVPPLDYELVKEVRAAFPQLKIILNGGVQSVEAAQKHLQDFDGVMLGRAAYQNPGILQDMEAALYGTTPLPLDAIVEKMIAYADDQKARFGTPLHAITKHMVGLNSGRPGARRWRQLLTVNALQASGAAEVLNPAFEAVSKPLELVA